MSITERQQQVRSASIRASNHQRWHTGAIEACPRCDLDADTLALVEEARANSAARAARPTRVGFPPLTPEQLATVEANLALIPFLMRRWRIPGRDWDEAHQDGVLGLMRAAQLYDAALGFQFSTYAQHQIRRAIQRGRDVREGINYRRNRDTYRAPLSIELPTTSITNGETISIGEHLIAADDVEGSTVEAMAGEEIVDWALALCRDDLDRAVLPIVLGRTTGRKVSIAIGVAESTIRSRALRLRSRLRHPVNHRQAVTS